MLHLGALVAAGAIAALYNVGVDRYAEIRTGRMAAIPALGKCPENATSASATETTTAAELRRTVSRRTGLVERPEDRCAWNGWLLSPSPAGARADGGGRGDEDGAAAAPPLEPGSSYAFAYRSYVNFEESGAIKRALFHAPTWMGFVSVRRGTFVVGDDGTSATLTDFFRKRFTPTTITWEGKLDWGGGGNEGGNPRIVWTSSSMITGRGKSRQTIERPPMSERLRQTPWDVIKVEDGIVGFRRGDVGMLAYAASSV